MDRNLPKFYFFFFNVATEQLQLSNFLETTSCYTHSKKLSMKMKITLSSRDRFISAVYIFIAGYIYLLSITFVSSDRTIQMTRVCMNTKSGGSLKIHYYTTNRLKLLTIPWNTRTYKLENHVYIEYMNHPNVQYNNGVRRFGYMCRYIIDIVTHNMSDKIYHPRQ